MLLSAPTAGAKRNHDRASDRVFVSPTGANAVAVCPRVSIPEEETVVATMAVFTVRLNVAVEVTPLMSVAVTV